MHLQYDLHNALRLRLNSFDEWDNSLPYNPIKPRVMCHLLALYKKAKLRPNPEIEHASHFHFVGL